MTIRKTIFAAMLTCLLFGACTLIAQAQARKVMVSTLLNTPPIEVKAAAIAGFDASIPTLPDGGAITFPDGGMIALGDAGITIPGQTVAIAFFGNRTSETAAPEGVAGAVITLQATGGPVITLKELTGGTHQLTSNDDAGLTYAENSDYKFVATSEGTTYTAKIEKVPGTEKVPQFHPPAGYVEFAANTAFKFDRPDPPAGQERPLGFVFVFPIDKDGKQAPSPTYTNVKTDVLSLLKLAIAPDDFRTTSITIPGTAFPDADKNYLVLLQSAKLGGPESENLFTGSAIIAGTADVAVVKTRP